MSMSQTSAQCAGIDASWNVDRCPDYSKSSSRGLSDCGENPRRAVSWEAGAVQYQSPSTVCEACLLLLRGPGSRACRRRSRPQSRGPILPSRVPETSDETQRTPRSKEHQQLVQPLQRHSLRHPEERVGDRPHGQYSYAPMSAAPFRGWPSLSVAGATDVFAASIPSDVERSLRSDIGFWNAIDPLMLPVPEYPPST